MKKLVKLPAILTAAEVALATATRATATATGPLAPFRRTSFIDDQSSTHQLTAIAGLGGLNRYRIVIDLNKPKPASLTTETIAQNIYTVDMNTGLCEERFNVRFSRFVGQIPHEQLSHLFS